VNELPIPDTLAEDDLLEPLAESLLLDLKRNAKKHIRNRADGSQRSEVNFQVSKSKPIIDEIDQVLAKHYNLSQEELDLVINYDIKYRGENDDE
jgi:hypothetical protein